MCGCGVVSIATAGQDMDRRRWNSGRNSKKDGRGYLNNPSAEATKEDQRTEVIVTISPQGPLDYVSNKIV